MAQKRMFDRSIMETDNFLNISLSAKAIYFLLGMEADDEGFVSPTRILRLYGGEKGDLKNLIDVGLIIPFKSGVIVITDWNQNNWLDNRRIKPTQYQIEKKMLVLTEQKKYELSNGLASAQLEERRGEENSIEQNSIPAIAEVKKSKYNSLGADILKAFEEIDPKNKTYYGNTTQRKACDYLLEEYGLEEVLKRITVLSKTNKIPYFPAINTPNDLKEKWVKLQDAVDKKRRESKTAEDKYPVI